MFDGELTDFHLDGDAATTLNGDRIEPTTRNRLTISSDHSRTEYTLSVTDDLEKSTTNGATIDESDTVSGTVASGRVFGGTDGYTFAGQLVFLDVEGDATVTLNGERLDPQQYNLLSIEGTGSRVEYSLSVSDRLEKSTANGASIGSEDRTDGSTASGAVSGGTDSYTFAGELENISIEGDANVTLNGSQLDTQSPGTWEGKARLPVEQSDANGGVVDGRLYYFGGFGQGHDLDAVKRAFVYEPDYSGERTWSRIEDLPRALWAPCGVATEDSLYSFGGAPSGSPYNGVDPSDEIFRYRPNDGWTNLTARAGVRCPYPNYTMAGVYNPDDGLIDCMGGGRTSPIAIARSATMTVVVQGRSTNPESGRSIRRLNEYRNRNSRGCRELNVGYRPDSLQSMVGDTSMRSGVGSVRAIQRTPTSGSMSATKTGRGPKKPLSKARLRRPAAPSSITRSISSALVDTGTSPH